MKRTSSQVGLKCPYCDEELPSHRDLRVHVGAVHRGKIDEFTEEHFGGRWIEVEFVTLMLQRALSGLTEEVCNDCGLCAPGCSSSQVIEGYKPHLVISRVNAGRVKEVLKSDLLWKCTSCLSCKEACPDETSPFEVVKTLRNLSARIGYHFPRFYRDLDRTIYRSGIVQEPQTVSTKTGERLGRGDLGLPPVIAPHDMTKFASALDELARKRVIL